MSDSVTMTEITNDMKVTLQKMTDRSNQAAAFARVVYPIYQQLQLDRFTSEGASEGFAWAKLSPMYSERKLKTFKSYPGSGRKLLIATSTLAGAIIGKGDHPFFGTDKHRAMFKSQSMEISVENSGTNEAGKPFNYASHVNQDRPFMKFSDASIQKMKDALTDFIKNG